MSTLTMRTLTQVIFRSWAVMLLAREVASVPALVELWSRTPSLPAEASFLFNARWMSLTRLVLQVVIAVLIFRQAEALSRWVVPEDRELSLTADADGLFAMALALVGLTVAIDGIVLVGSTLYAWLNTRAEPTMMSLNLERRTALVRGSLNVLIGAILFLGKDAIRRGWHRLRTAR